MPTSIAHLPVRKALIRWVARLLGVPVGLALILLLRLTSTRAGVALMYHSVDIRRGDPERELVAPHDVRLFEQQVRHLTRYYEVVPAARLREAAGARRRGQRFPAAITFDDDLVCHATLALPVLRRLGATATFFLSGASLDRPFAFPYERLQRAYDHGVPDLDNLVLQNGSTGTTMGVHELWRLMEGMTPGERDDASARLAAELGPDPVDSGIRASHVAELAGAGMTIGFHTLRHDPLTSLSDAQLRSAMAAGRAELAAAAGQHLAVIGYPHGRADERVAAAARAAGFSAGFTTRHLPVTPCTDVHMQGRVGPSRRSVGALAIELAITLLKAGTRRSIPAPGHRPS